MSKAVPFFLVFIFSLFPCTAEDPVTVSFSDTGIDPGSFALPEGFVLYDPNSPSEPDLVLLVRETLGPEKQPFALSREFLVPLKSPGDYRSSVSLEEIQNEQLSLVPLSGWEHAGMGLLVENLSPADTGYPLQSWQHIVLDWNHEPDPPLTMRLTRCLDEYLEADNRDSSPDLVWIGAVGDMMLQRGIEDILIHRPDGLKDIFSDLLPYLSGSDLLLGNLEGAVTLGGIKTPKSFNFRFQPAVLESLKNTGFDYLSITNNHCYDYGEEGFLDTLRYLREYGIQTSGAAESLPDAQKPSVFSRGGFIFRIMSVGAYPRERNGFNGEQQARVTDKRAGILWYGEEALSAISAFADNEGIDIVMVHGGHEWQRIPADEQKKQYRSFIDAGADIVFGSHPHVLQGSEQYNGGIIYYSLGNFLFNGMDEMPYAEDSLIAYLGICGGKILYRRDVPVQMNGPHVKKDQSGRIIRQFRDLSEGIIHP